MDATAIALLAAVGAFITSISSLILGLAGIWAQNKRDSKQAQTADITAKSQTELDKERLEIERDKADEETRQATLASLRAELDRLHENETKDRNRIGELENIIIDKTAKIGELMMAKIDAESEAAIMKNKMGVMQEKMDAMQLKLNSVLPEEPAAKKRKEETVPLAIRQTLEENENRKYHVMEETNKEIETFKSGSLANGTTTPPVEGE